MGEFTHQDIVKALKSPSQDPRTEFKTTEFRKDISTISDLKVDQWYPGIITNITQFGAFVDIGIKENGLLHVSQMADRFIENPLELFKVGEEVKVKVVDVDMDRKRIALSMKTEEGSTRTLPKQGSKTQKSNSNQQSAQNNIRNNAFAALKDFKVK